MHYNDYNYAFMELSYCSNIYGISKTSCCEVIITCFLPFNLIKGGLNAAFTMLLYKPLLGALKKSNVLQDVSHDESSEKITKVLLLYL